MNQKGPCQWWLWGLPSGQKSWGASVPSQLNPGRGHSDAPPTPVVGKQLSILAKRGCLSAFMIPQLLGHRWEVEFETRTPAGLSRRDAPLLSDSSC